MFSHWPARLRNWILEHVRSRRREQPRARPRAEPLEARELLTFQHPGLLYTQADFARMQAKVNAGAQPWLAGWNALLGDGYSQLGAKPNPQTTISRPGNSGVMVADVQRAFETALRWKVSGDTRYADQTVRFLNAWQYTMTGFSPVGDISLVTGLQGSEWANVAEIMRTYPGWAAQDVANFQNWMLTLWYPANHGFLTNGLHTGAATHYWANWDLCNMDSMEAIGIFCDRPDIYNEALDDFYHEPGTGAIDKAVFYQFDGYLAQWQESGRDQGHSSLGLALMAEFMQMAWNQGDDLWSYENNKFLGAAEYFAKYNLGYDVPFEHYAGNGDYTAISSGARGIYRPGTWDLIYNHYVNVEGLAAPYTAAYKRVDGGDHRGDELGFGTLTYTVDPIGGGQTPSGLTAREVSGGVTLNWWGEPSATNYNVYRSTDGSNFTRIASGITNLLTWTDQPGPGSYYYEVTGNESGGETAPSNVVWATTTPTLHTQLLFNEGGGTTANDNTGNGHTGTLMNGASFTGSSVNLDSSQQQYVSLPSGLMQGVTDFTIATWVNLRTIANNSRIFDFGDSNGRYMFLAPNSSGLRFAFGLNYFYLEQSLTGPVLPTNQWAHVAVTQSGRTLTMYVNGNIVASTTNQDFQPFQLGSDPNSTPNNWIGRSQSSGDPYLNGQVTDFRIYRDALSANDIYTLANGIPSSSVPAAPTSPAASAGDATVSLRWAAATGADVYNVKRATSAGGPYSTIATGVYPTGFMDTGLTDGTTYYYVVSAVNAVGESSDSVEVSATPTAPAVPATPTGLTATALEGAVSLSWTASTDAAGYNLWRATTSGGPYTSVARLLPGTSFTDSGLSDGITYFYVISAVNADTVESPDSTEVNSTPASLPAGWTDADVGNTALSGAAGFDGVRWTVAGSGSDIWSTADQFHFVSQGFTGDGTIIARVTGVQTTDAWAKAGIMFRDSSAADAAYALVMLTPGNGVSFQYRGANGGSAATAGTIPGLVAPVWVELTRSGNTFSAYTSPDGVSWSSVGGTVSISLSADAQVGLAVSSHDNGVLNTSTFDDVSVIGPAPTGLSAVAVPHTREIDLSWTNNDPNATAVVVERSTDGVHFVQVAILSGTPSGYTDTGCALRPHRHYWYRVRDLDSAGSSDYSNVADVFTGCF